MGYARLTGPRNNDYAKKYIALMKTNVVGEHGIQIQSCTRIEDNKLDKAANLIFEKEWHKWCKKGNYTLDGNLYFIDCQALIVDQIATARESLIQIVKNAENSFYLQQGSSRQENSSQLEPETRPLIVECILMLPLWGFNLT